jgi:hypothetical protein
MFGPMPGSRATMQTRRRSRFSVNGAVPTSVNTGLTTWVGQGAATIADTAAWIYLDIDQFHGANPILRTRAAPSAPYSFTAKIALNSPLSNLSNPNAGIGWTDGTKLHHVTAVLANNGVFQLAVSRFTNLSTFSANDFSGGTHAPGSSRHRMQIRDDGTNVSFGYSFDGANFITLFSVAKSSGWLGSSGYNTVYFFGSNGGNSNEAGVTLMSWKQGT